MMIELVVARYTEDLSWLRNIPAAIKVTVYDKGAAMLWPCALRLPNIGREAHSYLQHIVGRYDTLAPLSIFCQGRPFDHAYDFAATLRALASQAESVADFRWLGHIVDTDDRRGRTLFVPWSKNAGGHELDLDGFHAALLGAPGPAEYIFVPGGQFAATDKLIRARPREFYEQALQLAVAFPEAAHCFERCWDRVFGVEGVDLMWLAGRRTVYLKKIARLAADSASGGTTNS